MRVCREQDYPLGNQSPATHRRMAKKNKKTCSYRFFLVLLYTFSYKDIHYCPLKIRLYPYIYDIYRIIELFYANEFDLNSSEMQQNKRISNVELLRILSIFFITIHHLVIRGADTCGYSIPYTFDQGYIGIIINCFCIIGVNIFILISGWFGIKNPI